MQAKALVSTLCTHSRCRLMQAQEELPGGERGRDRAATPVRQEPASLETPGARALSPRARSAASAVQAAACKVVITPGGPLPLPAGAAWSDAQFSTSYSFGTPAQVPQPCTSASPHHLNCRPCLPSLLCPTVGSRRVHPCQYAETSVWADQDRITKATRALKQLQTGAAGSQGTLRAGNLPSPRILPGSGANSSAPSSQSVHDSQMSLPAPAVELTSQACACLQFYFPITRATNGREKAPSSH